jgi:hypothetical protein
LIIATPFNPTNALERSQRRGLVDIEPGAGRAFTGGAARCHIAGHALSLHPAQFIGLGTDAKIATRNDCSGYFPG